MSGSSNDEAPRVVDRRSAAEGSGGTGPVGECQDETEAYNRLKAEMPEIDFVTFVLSLSHNAMVSMGLLPPPDQSPVTRDLVLARQTIDILGMLAEKTRGNLTGEEERILDSILFDLRMSYVRVASGCD